MHRNLNTYHYNLKKDLFELTLGKNIDLISVLQIYSLKLKVTRSGASLEFVHDY